MHKNIVRSGMLGVLVASCAACSSGAPGTSSGGTTTVTVSSAARSGASASASTQPTSPTSTAPSTQSPTSTAPATMAEATAALARVSGTTGPAVVRVGTTYEAATLGSDNQVIFWTGDGRTWKDAGSSPHLPVFGTAAAAPTVSGALLPGATHAIFIVDGAFTGDGSGQALAYGRGTSSWSLYAAQPDSSLAPSGHGVSSLNGDPGLELDMRFTSGGFQTSSLWGSRSPASYAEQTSHPTVRNWKARGSRLVLTSDNVFTARRAASAGTVTNNPVHEGSALPNGTWMARLNGVTPSGALAVQPIQFKTCSGADSYCTNDVGNSVELTVPDNLSTTLLDGSYSSTFTAPGWFFVSVAGQLGENGPASLSAFRPGAPYVVSPKVATTASAVRLLQVSVSGGRVTGLSSVFTP